jgi:hypothetical protein
MATGFRFPNRNDNIVVLYQRVIHQNEFVLRRTCTDLVFQNIVPLYYWHLSRVFLSSKADRDISGIRMI